MLVISGAPQHQLDISAPNRLDLVMQRSRWSSGGEQAKARAKITIFEMGTWPTLTGTRKKNIRNHYIFQDKNREMRWNSLPLMRLNEWAENHQARVLPCHGAGARYASS